MQQPREIIIGDRVPALDGTIMYRLTRIEGGKYYSINTDETREIIPGEWVNSDLRVVDFAKNETQAFISGFHVIDTLDSAQKYLEKINPFGLPQYTITKVEVGEVRRKPNVNLDVYLTDKIKLIIEDKINE